MVFSWSDFSNKLPEALNTIGQFAAGIEQMHYQREMCKLNRQNPSIWMGNRGYSCGGMYGNDGSAVLNAGIADMDNFTCTVINSLQTDSTLSGSANAGTDTPQNGEISTSALSEGKDVSFVNDGHWAELNSKYEDLEGNEKSTWFSTYKSGLGNLAKSFMKTVNPSSTSETSSVTKEQFEKLIKDHVNKDSKIADSEVKDLADKLWANANTDNNDTIDEQELSVLLALIDEQAERDAKITSQEFLSGLQNLGKEEFKAKFTEKRNELYPDAET